MNFRLSVTIVEFWRLEVARSGNFAFNFCFFWKNDHLWWNFKNYVPKVYMATTIDVVVVKCRKICPTWNRWNRALFRPTWQKNSRLPQTVATARIAPKIFWSQPPTMCSQCSRFHPNRFIFGEVIAERVNTVILPRRVLYFSDSPPIQNNPLEKLLYFSNNSTDMNQTANFIEETACGSTDTAV